MWKKGLNLGFAGTSHLDRREKDAKDYQFQQSQNTLDSCVAMANFMVMTPQQAANTVPVPHEHVLLINSQPEKGENMIGQLFHEQTENDGNW